jgi:hypothetical protein
VSAVAGRLLVQLRGVLAVASLAARAALRSRGVLAVGILTVVFPLVLVRSASGDGTPTGALRSLLSWSLGFDAFVLSLTFAFLGVGVAADLKAGRLTQVVTGPVRREALALGWWLGSGAAACVLVVVAGVSLYAATALDLALAGDPEQVASLNAAIQARGVSRPPAPDDDVVAQAALEQWEELQRSGRLPEGVARSEALERLERAVRTRMRTVDRGRLLRWELRGVHPAPGAEQLTLVFRYQYQSLDQAPTETTTHIRGRFLIGPLGSERALEVPGTWVAGERHSVALPVEVLAGGDALTVTYQNLEDRALVALFPEHGVEVLYPAGSFTGNLLRASLVLLGRLLCLIAVGVGAALLLDGRLAAGVVLWFLAVSSGRGLLEESLAGLDPTLRGALTPFLALLPDLAREDLAGDLAVGLRVGWGAVARSLGADALLRGGVILAGCAAAFARRELGAIRA